MEPPLSWQYPYSVNVYRTKSNQMYYTLGIPNDAYQCLAGRGGEAMYPNTSFQRSHVLHVDVCIISPLLHIDMQFSSYVIIKIIAIISLQTYSKHIPSRSYVYLVHTFEEPCTSSTYFHHLTHITYKHAVYMIFHHKNNCNHRFSNLFQHIPPRSYVHSLHPFEEPCTPSTSFRGALYPIHILSRSYVLQGRTFIISHALHTSMQFTWDDIIKFNHRFSYLFHAYMISQYQTINNIDNQIKIWVPYYASYKRSCFLQPWGHPHIVWLL